MKNEFDNVVKSIIGEQTQDSGGLGVYYFHPNTYDYEYMVMARSEEEARNYLLAYAEKQESAGDTDDARSAVRAANLEGKYNLKRYGVGEVIQTEIA